MKDDFLQHGFTKLDKLIPFSEVEKIRVLYDKLLADKQKTVGLRSDLSGATTRPDAVEKITQIMRPSMVEPAFAQSIAYQQALEYAKSMLGNDMALDFDMLINKAPYTNTPTPLHQDAAYWIALPDKRAVSCWIALDEVYAENGCMWFVPKQDDMVKEHTFHTKGGALFCEADISAAQCIPLRAGGCTFHDGFTLHFSKGNVTKFQRRALILNFRPAGMIALEREQGVDHTGERKVRNT